MTSADYSNAVYIVSVLTERLRGDTALAEDSSIMLTPESTADALKLLLAEIDESDIRGMLGDLLFAALGKRLNEDTSFDQSLGLSAKAGRKPRGHQEKTDIVRSVLLRLMDGDNSTDAVGRVADKMHREQSVVQKIYGENREWASARLAIEVLLEPEAFSKAQIERLRAITVGIDLRRQ